MGFTPFLGKKNRLPIKIGITDTSGSPVHELQNGCQVGERDVLQDDDGVLGRVLLKEVLEVGRACTEDHLVCLGVLTLKKHENFGIEQAISIPR